MTTHDSGSMGEEEAVLFQADEEMEMARQIIMQQRVSETLGGLMPEQPDLSWARRVLDVACGSGGWALALAQAYPHLQAIGIDSSQLLIDYARAQAWTRGLSNVAFLVHDLGQCEPLPASVHACDLVNLAFVAGWMPTGDYSALLSCLVHACRLGGMLRWTEYDMPITSSAALTELTAHLARAVSLSGQPVILCEHRYSMIHLMGAWLRQAGFEEIRHHATVVDVSAGTVSHACFLRQTWVMAQQARTLLLKRGILTRQAAEELLRRVRREMQEQHFYGVCLVVTVRGKRGNAVQPEEEQIASKQEARREMA